MRTSHFIVGRGPRGQFVYTGSRPDAIEILEVMPAEDMSDDRDRWDDSSQPSSSGAGGDFDDKSESTSSSGGGESFDDKSGSGGDFPSAY